MGSRRGETPSGHSGEITFTCVPVVESALTSGGQSEVRAVIQQFPAYEYGSFHLQISGINGIFLIFVQ